VLLAATQQRRTTFVATRHVLWAPNTPEMRLRARPDHKRIVLCIKSPGNCLVAADVVLFLLNQIW